MDVTLDVLRRARLLDRSADLCQTDVLYPFALEELLCRQVGEGADPIIHIWRHPRAFVIGLRDNRLPCAAHAKTALAQSGYSVAVRNSGGAAVPLDAGVVNVTMIVPKQEGTIDFRKDFERMYRFVELALSERTRNGGSQTVAKGEIAGSYCPGDYDLSINGRKFCGIAQRRQLRALAVQAFFVVEGNGAERAELAAGFYEQAVCGQPASYPVVTGQAMVSLSEALHDPSYKAPQFVQEMSNTLRSLGSNVSMSTTELPDEDHIAQVIAEYRRRYDA